MISKSLFLSVALLAACATQKTGGPVARTALPLSSEQTVLAGYLGFDDRAARPMSWLALVDGKSGETVWSSAWAFSADLPGAQLSADIVDLVAVDDLIYVLVDIRMLATPHCGSDCPDPRSGRWAGVLAVDLAGEVKWARALRPRLWNTHLSPTEDGVRLLAQQNREHAYFAQFDAAGEVSALGGAAGQFGPGDLQFSCANGRLSWQRGLRGGSYDLSPLLDAGDTVRMCIAAPLDQGALFGLVTMDGADRLFLVDEAGIRARRVTIEGVDKPRLIELSAGPDESSVTAIFSTGDDVVGPYARNSVSWFDVDGAFETSAAFRASTGGSISVVAGRRTQAGFMLAVDAQLISVDDSECFAVTPRTVELVDVATPAPIAVVAEDLSPLPDSDLPEVLTLEVTPHFDGGYTQQNECP